MKKEAMSRRQVLIEHRKVFKAKDKEGQLTMLDSHLKEFQQEIDKITERAKLGESAFQNLYKLLTEMPNLLPVLSQLMDSTKSITSYELEYIKLKNEISQYEDEFQSLKNQDITIRRLEDEIAALRDDFEEKIASELKERSRLVEQDCEERIAQIKDLQKAAEKKFQASVERVKLAQEATERAQNDLFDVSSRSDNRINALLAENTTLMEDLQREMSMTSQLKRELEGKSAALSTSNENSSGSNGSSASSNKYSLKDDADAFRESLLELRKEMARREDAWRVEKNKIENQVRELTVQLGKEKESNYILKQANDTKSSKDVILKLIRRFQYLQKLSQRTLSQQPLGLDISSVSGAAGVPNSYNLFEGVSNGDLLGFNTYSDNHLQPTFDINEELLDMDTRMAADVPFEITLLTHYNSMRKELYENKRTMSDFEENEERLNAEISSLKSSLESSIALSQKLENDLELHSTMTSTPSESVYSRHSRHGMGGGGGGGGMVVGAADSHFLSGGKNGSSNIGLAFSSSNLSNNINRQQGQAQMITAAELSQLLQVDGPASGPGASVDATTGGGSSSSSLTSSTGVGVGVGGGGESGGGGGYAATASNKPAAASSLQQQQMISILTSQRDRYKTRIVQLETNVSQLQSQLDNMSLSKSQLEADNVSLYAKLRFFQATGTNSMGGANGKGGMLGGGGGGGRLSGGGYLFDSPPSKLNSGGGSGGGGGDSFSSWLTTPDKPPNFNNLQDIENKYSHLYESNLINPFSQFSTHEKQRKLDEMPMPDRLVIMTTLAFVSSAKGRTFALVYISLMHLLVFFTLYYMAHSHHDCV